MTAIRREKLFDTPEWNIGKSGGIAPSGSGLRLPVAPVPPFTAYKGYRIFTPTKTEIRRDNHGCYLVHVHFSRRDGAIEERINIPACVAGSLLKAQEMSVKHAVRIIDEREDPSATCPTASEPATNSEERTTRPVSLRSAVSQARKLMQETQSLANSGGKLAKRLYIDALEALHACLMDELNVAEKKAMKKIRVEQRASAEDIYVAAGPGILDLQPKAKGDNHEAILLRSIKTFLSIPYMRPNGEVAHSR